MKIQQMHPSLRPREKAMAHGVTSLSDRELLAIVVRNGMQNRSALEVADMILQLAGSIQGLLEVDLKKLMTIPGVKTAKGIEIMTVVELTKRIVKPRVMERIDIYKPHELIAWLSLDMGYLKQEHFGVVFLNRAYAFLGYEVIFKGTIDRALVHPREIIVESFKRDATHILLVHNHPGGTMAASRADYDATEHLVLACEMVGICVVDHLIVSCGLYFSLKIHYPELFRE